VGEGLTLRDPAVQEMLDKQAIREAIMRYCRGADRCDPEMVSSAYHPDAVDERPGEGFTGQTVGGGLVKSLRETMQSTSHQIGTQLIEVAGDTAVCESYSTGQHVLKDGRRLHTLVRYLDRFEKRAGEWRIVHRVVITDATDLLPPLDGPHLGPPSRARRDRSDPSYTLFRSSDPSS
jgi:ketosteroid isomerase-like protein